MVLTTGVIVDTGPLVALLNRRDAYHGWMAMQVETLPVDWVVCEPVLAEAWYLVRRATGCQDRLLDMLETGVIKCDFETA